MIASTLSVRALLTNAIDKVLPRRRHRHQFGGRFVEQLEERVLFNTCTDRPEIPQPYPPCTDCPCDTGGPGAPNGGTGGVSGGSANGTYSGGGGATHGGTAPFPPGISPASSTSNPVRYIDGAPEYDSVDLSSSGFGYNLEIDRSWAGFNNTGPVGNGWMIKGMPYLVIDSVVDDSGSGYKPVVAVVDGGTNQRLFVLNTSTGVYTPEYFTQDKLTYVGPSGGNPGKFILNDTAGNTLTFFDLPRDSSTGKLQTSQGYAQQVTNQNASFNYRFGMLQSITDPYGNVTTATYDTSTGNIDYLQRTDAASGASERFDFSYTTISNSLGGSATLASSIDLQRLISGNWETQRSAAYTYSTGELSPGVPDPNGRLGDLMLVQIKDPLGNVIQSSYYRYYKFTGEELDSSAGPTNNPSTTGGPTALDFQSNDNTVFSGLKMAFEGPSVARLASDHSDFQSAADSTVQPYANNYFQYERWGDANWSSKWWQGYHTYTHYRVINETAQAAGCGCAGGTGQGTDKLEYISNENDATGIFGNENFDPNVWRVKTTEYLPGDDSDWGTHDRNVVYLNEAGEPLLLDQASIDKSDHAISAMSVGSPAYSGTTMIGFTITVTSTAHGFNTGDYAALSGITTNVFDEHNLDKIYNGIYQVTRIDANTFSFVLPLTDFFWYSENNSPGAPAPTISGSSVAAKVLGQTLTAFRYDSAGRLIQTAQPSAVAGYDESRSDPTDKLVNNSDVTDGWLSTSSGLIHVYNYGASTTATSTSAGDVAGFFQSEQLKQGTGGTPISLDAQQYKSHTDGNGVTVYVLANYTAYGDSSGGDARITTYDDTWYGTTNGVQSVTTTLPVISSLQNGPGVSDVNTTFFDTYGHAMWTKDGDGHVNYTAFDPGTGAVTTSIVDVNYSQLTPQQQSLFPSGWAQPSGLHLKTTYVVDGLGRPTEETSPNGNITYTVYNDANHETRVYPGFNGTTTTGPIQITRQFWPAAGSGDMFYTENITSTATPHLTNGVPDGTETIAANNIATLSRDFTNVGGLLMWSDKYFDLGAYGYTQGVLPDGSGNPIDIGAQATFTNNWTGNFYRTGFLYDDRGRQYETIEPTGTIDITIFDFLSRPTSSWVGTDATPGANGDDWTPDNQGASSNMMDIEDDVYDNGGVGDGNLTQVTQHPGLGQPDRVTQSLFDFRDRLAAHKAGIQATENDGAHRPITSYTFDNLDEQTAAYQYDGDGIPLSDFTSTAITDAPPTADASALRAKNTSSYDDQGRVYLQQTFSVDQSTGAIGSALATDTFYDHRGNAVGVFNLGGTTDKSVYDGAGRIITQYTTDGGATNNGGSLLLDWAHATVVTSDVVLEQIDTTYDGDGNVTLTATHERFDNDPSTAVGALGGPGSRNLAARIYYLGNYYDPADRLTTQINVGTNGGSQWIRPDNKDDPLLTRSDTVLRNDAEYSPGGNVFKVTDPRDLVTQFGYDMLNRKIQEFDGGVPDSEISLTDWAYDGNDDVITMTAEFPRSSTPSQSTLYKYGVGGTAHANLFSNNLIFKVIYPDPATGSATDTPDDEVAFSYDVEGKPISKIDQNQVIHTYAYDVLARLVSDTVVLGPGAYTNVDMAIGELGYTYDALGLLFKATSYLSSNGSVDNQTEEIYNGFGQLLKDYQSHSGAVNTSVTPVVQYGYDAAAHGSRLLNVTYPNGRVLDYVYNPGLDSATGRVSALADNSGSGAGNLQTYNYLGLNTIVQEADSNGSELTYIHQPTDTLSSSDGGDRYTGLDRFGQVIDQWWLNPATSTTTDRFQYGYDRDGNVLYKNNRVNSSFSELYHANSTAAGDDNAAYDNLNRVTAFRRGTLSASANNNGVLDTVSTLNTLANSSQSWNLDALGNAGSVTTDGTQQPRTFNSQNEATNVGGSTLTYDYSGNTTRDQSGNLYTYDAWNRLVFVNAGSASVLWRFDALGRRMYEWPSSGKTDLYYSAAGQVLEEQQGGVVVTQNVWGIDYVNQLVLRDDNSTGGDLGKAGSGLGRRIFVQQDADYNVSALTDVTGAPVQRFIYTPYGEQTVLTPSWTQTADAYNTHYTFQGGRFDTTTGIIHFGAPGREYLPTLGRWVEKDISYFDGANLYENDGSNPVDRADPVGMWWYDTNGPYFNWKDGYCYAYFTHDKVAGWGDTHIPGFGYINLNAVAGTPDHYTTSFPLHGIDRECDCSRTGVTKLMGKTGMGGVLEYQMASMTATELALMDGLNNSDASAGGFALEAVGMAVGGVVRIKAGSSGGPTAGKPFPESIKSQARAENPSATCVYCKRPGTGTQVDHAIPRAQGGNATLPNAQLACPHCNASKGRTADSRDAARRLYGRVAAKEVGIALKSLDFSARFSICHLTLHRLALWGTRILYGANAPTF